MKDESRELPVLPCSAAHPAARCCSRAGGCSRRGFCPQPGLDPAGAMTPCVFAAQFWPECQTCRVAAVWGGQAFHLHSHCHRFDMQSRPHGGVLPPVPASSPALARAGAPLCLGDASRWWRSCGDIREGNSLCPAALSLPLRL